MQKRIKRVGRILLKCLGGLLGLGILYGLMALLMGMIPVNRSYVPVQEGIKIFVRTNGYHASLTLPVHTDEIDWRQQFVLSDFGEGDMRMQWIDLGWGEKQFYVETPTWSDLTARTLLQAIFVPSTSALHVTYLSKAPAESPECTSIWLTPEQYHSLVTYLQETYPRNNSHTPVLIRGKGYTSQDNFYEAHGKYHLFNTCNNWVNRGLKRAGVRTALWTPLDQGIFFHLK